MRKITVAIDGPAGAGKSSVAKMVANRLHYLYIDTGAMYRAFTWAMLERHINIRDEKAVQQLTGSIQIRLEPGEEVCRVYADGQDITEEIRTPFISSHVSQVAALAVVRAARDEQACPHAGAVCDITGLDSCIIHACFLPSRANHRNVSGQTVAASSTTKK